MWYHASSGYLSRSQNCSFDANHRRDTLKVQVLISTRGCLIFFSYGAIAELGISRRPSNHEVKSWRRCYNFAKGACRFGTECKFVHDTTVKNSGSNSSGLTNNNTEELFVTLLKKLGVHDTKPGNGNITNPSPVGTGKQPVAYHSFIPPSPYYPSQAGPLSYGPPGSPHVSPSVPPGFYYPPVHPYYPAHHVPT